ncbi:MAG: prepilin-type N-terminal cleavage/methylation domain-containing protein, partial [Halioglobus sp.]|nr:prepilin-type N-terminal cleavage/methylation domain-containing protein [Halioglobus sp.]
MARLTGIPRTLHADAGFTLLELVVVIVIVSVLLVTAINRLLPYLDEAERVSV